MVITLDFESSDPGSNPGRTFFSLTRQKIHGTVTYNRDLTSAVCSLSPATGFPCSVAGLRGGTPFLNIPVTSPYGEVAVTTEPLNETEDQQFLLTDRTMANVS